MSETARNILAAAMALPENERLEIAGTLLHRLSPDISALALDDPDLRSKLALRSEEKDGEVSWEELQRSVGETP